MFSLLLVIIYIAFISLGLPDSLVGSAWPVMHLDLNVPISYAGIITMIIAGGTIVSSLLSDRITKKMGAGPVTAVSVLMTAAALFGFSVSTKFWMLCAAAVPYGLGAGAVDAALNNYVALHYKSRHMSWLHCFWGIGASLSPYIMASSLTGGSGWSGGYRTVSLIQIALTAVLFLSLPVWRLSQKRQGLPAGQIKAQPPERPKSIAQILKIKGLPLMLVTFFAYCSVEATAMLWASSYLVEFRNIGADTAAMLASLFFLGITFGRFISGFVSERAGDKRLIRIGVIAVLFGVALIAVPDRHNICSMAGLVIAGLGCAPVYPSIIHSTPENFGKENSQAAIGVQMASAYIGATFMPPLFGLIAQHINIGFFPLYLFIFAAVMLVMSELLNKATAKGPL